MNNKIKAAEVACLIDGKEAYEKIYNSLKASLPTDEEMIFAERSSGYGFLQWELPEEGWVSLDQSDPIQAIEVRQELERRIGYVRTKFGDNQNMANKILTYPDESYVFFKRMDNGKLHILITAWGYRHPVKIEGGSAGGSTSPWQTKEPVVIRIIYGGKPMPSKTFKLNGMEKQTDAEGQFLVGDLPIGYQFDAEVDEKNLHFTVAKDEGLVVIDATKYATLEVLATFDGKPYSKATVAVSYNGQQMQLCTDDMGKTKAQVLLGLDGQLCSVTVGSESQSKPLSETTTRFVFDFVTSQQMTDQPQKETPVGVVHPKDTQPGEKEPANEVSKEEKPKEEKEDKKEEQPETSSGHGGVLTSLLLGLLLALLVATSYYFGWYFTM